MEMFPTISLEYKYVRILREPVMPKNYASKSYISLLHTLPTNPIIPLSGNHWLNDMET